MQTSFLKPLVVGIAFSGALAINTNAADWTQYRGSAANGASLESWALQSGVPTNGLPRLWQAKAETGFSSFTVAGGKAFTIVARQIDGVKREVLVALDAADGKELWAVPFGVARYDGGGDSGTQNNKGGDGPRSTPSVNDGRVYVYSSAMKLSCFDVKDGKQIWAQDIAKDFGGKNIQWQSAASPLVDSGKVFVVGGGEGQSLLAFDQVTGANAWKTQNDGMHHATPTAATIQGVRQVVFLTKVGLVGVAVDSGNVLWRQDFAARVAGASPVVSGDLVYCSAGYNVGAQVVRIKKEGDKLVPEVLWKKPNQLMNQWSTPVVKDGYLYGLFGHAAYGSAPLKCVELATGVEKWSKANFGMGGVIVVDGHLVTLCDSGELAIIKATPESYQQEGIFQAIGGKCWSTPAFSDGKIYLRSTTEGVCYAATK
jgi:outer membrane protein assembly factor BamB